MTAVEATVEFDVFCPGVLEVLSIGKGDTKIIIGGPDDVDRARRIIEEMLRAGYSIFVETDREKLRGLLSPRQWRMYDLTGSFLETSERSAVTYLFRRLRPTVALTDRWWSWTDRRTPDRMRCLAVLCLHPVGYVERSWGGCMVPSDDVLAHLLLMRADEAGFWKHANQHPADAPEAGL